MFKCKVGFECKGGSGTPAAFPTGPTPMLGAPGLDPNTSVTCHLHGKPRKANVCTQVATGLWECTPATRCKGAATAQARYSPYGTPQAPAAAVPAVQPAGGALGYTNEQLAQLGATLASFAQAGGLGALGVQMPVPQMAMQVMPTVAAPAPQTCIPVGGGAASGEMATCAIHGKQRLMNYLQECTPGVPGMYRCRDDTQCKAPGAAAPAGAAPLDGAVAGPPETAVCAIHGRKRLVTYMIKDETTGLWQCKPGFECKMGGPGGAAPAATS